MIHFFSFLIFSFFLGIYLGISKQLARSRVPNDQLFSIFRFFLSIYQEKSEQFFWESLDDPLFSVFPFFCFLPEHIFGKSWQIRKSHKVGKNQKITRFFFLGRRLGEGGGGSAASSRWLTFLVSFFSFFPEHIYLENSRQFVRWWVLNYLLFSYFRCFVFFCVYICKNLNNFSEIWRHRASDDPLFSFFRFFFFWAYIWKNLAKLEKSSSWQKRLQITRNCFFIFILRRWVGGWEEWGVGNEMSLFLIKK